MLGERKRRLLWQEFSSSDDEIRTGADQAADVPVLAKDHLVQGVCPLLYEDTQHADPCRDLRTGGTGA